MVYVQRKTERENKMTQKQHTLEELEKLLGKEQMDRLFLEHYLTLARRVGATATVADNLNLEDIME